MKLHTITIPLEGATYDKMREVAIEAAKVSGQQGLCGAGPFAVLASLNKDGSLRYVWCEHPVIGRCGRHGFEEDLRKMQMSAKGAQ